MYDDSETDVCVMAKKPPIKNLKLKDDLHYAIKELALFHRTPLQKYAADLLAQIVEQERTKMEAAKSRQSHGDESRRPRTK